MNWYIYRCVCEKQPTKSNVFVRNNQIKSNVFVRNNQPNQMCL